MQDFYKSFHEKLPLLTEDDMSLAKSPEETSETGLGFASEHEVDSILDNTKEALKTAIAAYKKVSENFPNGDFGVVEPTRFGFKNAIAKYVAPEDTRERFRSRLEKVATIHNAFIYDIASDLYRGEIEIKLSIALINYTPEVFRKIMEFEFGKIYSTAIPKINKQLIALQQELNVNSEFNKPVDRLDPYEPELVRYFERAPRIVFEGIKSIMSHIHTICEEARDPNNQEDGLVHAISFSVGQVYIYEEGQQRLFGIVHGV